MKSHVTMTLNNVIMSYNTKSIGDTTAVQVIVRILGSF